MANPIQAEKRGAHFAAIIPPMYSPSKMGRMVPTTPAITLDKAILPAEKTYGRTYPYFHLGSTAVDPKIGSFQATVGSSTITVESHRACCHGDEGIFTSTSGATFPAAIYADLDQPKYESCLADAIALMAQILRDLVDHWDEFMDAVLDAAMSSFAKVFEEMWEAVKAACDTAMSAGGSILDTLSSLTFADIGRATIKGAKLLGSLPQKIYSIVQSAYSQGKQAIESMMAELRALHAQLQELLNDPEQLLATLEELMKDLGENELCQLRDALVDIAKDPAKKLGASVGEVLGIAAAEVACVALSVIGGLIVSALSGGTGIPAAISNLALRLGMIAKRAYQMLKPAGKVLGKLFDPKRFKDAMARAKEKIKQRRTPNNKDKPDPNRKPPSNNPPNDGNNTPDQGGQADVHCMINCKGAKVGKPVNPLLGSKVREEEEELDFALPAPLPLTWQRSYNSKNARIGLLGQGWTLPIGMALEVRLNRTILHDAQGRKVRFGPLAVGAAMYSPFEHIDLKRGGGAAMSRLTLPGDLPWDADAAVVEDDDMLLYFRRPSRGRRRSLWPLRAMVDRNGYTVRFFADEEGHPQGVIDSAGRHLLFSLTHVASDLVGDDGLRLAGVVLAYDPQRDKADTVLPADPADYPASHWLVRYDYDAAGDLVQVRDGHGRTRCRMNYRNHLMVRFGHPEGLVTEYEYDAYQPSGRVTVQRALHAEGEAPAALDYRFDYQPGRTIVTDSLGRTTVYRFSGRPRTAAQRWIGTIHPDGSEDRFDYDGFGNLIEVLDRAGRSSRFYVDGHGRPLTIESPAGRVEMSYDEAGNLLAQTNTLGHRWQFVYDERGNLFEESDPLGQTTRYFYDDPALPDHPTRIRDARGGVKRLEWDRCGQLLAYTDCSGKTTRYRYDANGRPSEITDALGQTVHYHYDAYGRLSSVTQPDGATERFAYDSLDRLIAYRDAAGVDTVYTLDRAGRALARRNGLGHTLAYRYDAAGRLLTLTNENGVDYRFTYDAADRLTEEIGFDGRHTVYGYDRSGALVEQVEYPDTPYARRTAYRRDKVGRLIEKHTASGTTRYRYDAAGQLLEARNGDSSIKLGYDPLSQLIEETSTIDGITTTLRHRYDSLGNRTATVLPDGRTLNWLHYGSGHLHQVNLDGEVICDLERDDLHREIARQQGPLESRFAYDRGGRLAWQGVFRRGHRSEAPRLVDPTHPIYGDPLAWEALGGKASGSARFARSYRYDQAGQLSEIRDSRRGALQYRYDAIGRLLGALHPNGLQETFAFDPAHNLLDPMGGHGLSLDDGKQPANSSQDTETDFKEKIRKLLEDPEWNPLTHPIEATPTTSPGGGPRDNRLRVFEDKRFDYDVYGNLTEKRIGRHTVMRFEYDGDHQMIAAHVTRHGLTQTTRYGYDPFGRRVSKRDAFGITRFNWDGNRLLSERRGAHSRLFIYEPDSFVPMAQVEVLNTASTLEMAEDEELETPVLPTNPAERIAALQAMALQAQMPKAVQPSGSVQIRYYHCDHLGTPRELSDQQGRLVWAAEYKAWGNTVRVEYPDVVDKAEQEEIQQPLRFQGQYYDNETGLHYNRFRYYDPDISSFTSQDPIKTRGGNNLYSYVANPTQQIDPLGLSCMQLNDGQKRRIAALKERIEKHHSLSDYKGLIKDLKGNPVPRKDGKPGYYQHFKEVSESMNGKDGLKVETRRLKLSLNNPKLCPEAKKELAEAVALGEAHIKKYNDIIDKYGKTPPPHSTVSL
ncbi:RHS repeat-associated core domain-containing protein [Chitinimonas lacunae]|uniref:RHS repeat-associated core domain-containing protein n=1 Tax=Chitinimonas lacunae TaxID=1963018 RepID=A0ABV8MLL8_9NEIS